MQGLLTAQTTTLCTMVPAVIPIQEAFGLNSSMPINYCAMSFAVSSTLITFFAIWAY